MFYLLDLERTIRTGCSFYWKPAKWGYTNEIVEAGQYSLNDAVEIVENDMDNRTIMIPVEVVEKILS